ncbi:hypothetical protein DFH09DRAFT_1324538 [Mycena vulgaris]|nr:hypothetical protein DFH09DRAFT_1324538 [Mycena vulgaris]
MADAKKKKKSFLAAIASDPPATHALTCSASSSSPIVTVTSAPPVVLASQSSLPTPSPDSTANHSDPPPTSSTKSTRLQSAKDQQAEAARFKKEFITTSTQLIEDAASFDQLARVFGDVLHWTEGNKTISVEFGKVLRAIQERLVNHLTIVCESETTTSFSSLLLQSVSPVLKQLSEQSAAQHKAIASLAKELENVKKPHASYAAVLASAATSLPHTAPIPKPKPPPLPSPAEERLLVHFNGDTPPILAAPYPEILRLANAHLQSLSLPLLLYAQKQNSSSLFIVPAFKANMDVLTAEWARWSPGVFPGARITPVLHPCIRTPGSPDSFPVPVHRNHPGRLWTASAERVFTQ